MLPTWASVTVAITVISCAVFVGLFMGRISRGLREANSQLSAINATLRSHIQDNREQHRTFFEGIARGSRDRVDMRARLDLPPAPNGG